MPRPGIQRRLFGSDVIRRLTVDSVPAPRQSAADATGSVTAFSKDSFLYDPPGTGVKSTQQIPIDYSKFENHTFFNSAEAKVNVGFDEIINYFPFDGSKLELNEFLVNLTGFEKYLYDSFPKQLGFLHFSSDHGNFISVKDFSGHLFPALSKEKTGRSTLDPGKSSITFEFELYVPVQSVATHNQVIVQKIGSEIAGATRHSQHDSGITIALSGTTAGADTVNVIMMVSSGSAFLSSSMSGTLKNKWHHICATYNRNPGKNRLELYRDAVLKSTSDTQYSMEDIGGSNYRFVTAPCLIGSGTAQTTGSATTAEMAIVGARPFKNFVPHQTLSGAIDELRIFHDVRSESQQRRDMERNIFSGSNELKLYFKFNEATGSYSNNDVVLDSSGNSLHSQVTNFQLTDRTRKGLELPLRLEKAGINPVLFPDNVDVVNLNSRLLVSGSEYDVNNPNMITKLIPVHYLFDASKQEGMDGPLGNMTGSYEYYETQVAPGGGRIPSPQIVASILLTWAKYFDEIKIFLDHFSNLLHVDYNDTDTIAEQFLPFLASYYGFEMPSQFSNASLSQMIEGDDLLVDASNSDMSLRAIQSQIWRRILVNLNEIIRSKGTVHSIKALMRSVGLSPNGSFRFREFGGSNTRALADGRIYRTEVSTMLDMSASLYQDVPPTLSAFGTGGNVPFLMSTFLSGARVEPGWPFISDMDTSFSPGDNAFIPDPLFVERPGADPHPDNYVGRRTVRFIGTENVSDGLFTSGSWMYEGYYKFEPLLNGLSHFATQSLARLCTTGSLVNTATGFLDGGTLPDPGGAYPIVNANLVAFQSGSVYETGSIRLYVQSDLNPGNYSPSWGARVDQLVLSLNDVNIFDGDRWHISFGRRRSDSFGSVVSSSFFVRAGKQNFGELITYRSASALYQESNTNHPGIPIDAGTWNNFQLISNNESLMPGFFGTSNASGSFIAIGSQSLGPINPGTTFPAVGPRFLNAYGPIAGSPDEAARYTNFSGKVARMRFWSEALSATAAREHVINFNSLGVEDPLTNFNFVTTKSGSFGKLRMDVSADQTVTQSNATNGGIMLQDFSQHNTFVTGSGFEFAKGIIKPEIFNFSMIDSKFDEGTNDNKIRIRSWQQFDNVEKYGGELAPLYETPASERPYDDTRFAIEVSCVQALNEDMINMFSSLEFLNVPLGAPELLFAENYYDLQLLRDVYFNRLTDKVDLKKFFEFYKWIDGSIGAIIENLIPRKTNFLGMNFVIESHMLERSKFQYGYSDMYLAENKRHGLLGTQLLDFRDVTLDED